ncbi:ATPase [Luteitalea sp. TBR-22]|uniref:cation-translocating P-type ATPase n=1 Tax=Luteitalea sp. TBR-22 TaxID=2802971 RepID=UPI001AF67A3D|nr:cation-transporting P-type ATPase [Luteitalea sp. TBR-22]BCS32572.1 ATPase [Luteitalea sp. TBR-22]
MSAHQSPIDELLGSLGTTPTGLSSREATRRQREFGVNHLERAPRAPLALQFAAQFTHVFALVLWLAAALAVTAHVMAPGQQMDRLAWAIVAVILVNGLFAFWQVYHAEEAFQALQRLLPHEVTVWRDGRAARLPAESLVPGDVVQVEAGDSIAADCRLLEAHGLRIDTSTLTGESHPVPRDAAPDDEPVLVRSRNALLAGTSVVSGRGRAVVLATGMHTEFGRVARLTQGVAVVASPLQREISRLSRVITVLALAAGAGVFMLGEALGLSRWGNLVFAVGIIVANVPEGLLPTLTLALAMASRRMARRNVLVRRLTAVEALGGTTVICTDKTGTLTENRMALRVIAAAGGQYEEGAWRRTAEPAVLSVLQGARRCHGLVGDAAGRWCGDPMEVALVEAAVAAGAADAEKIDEVPFDALRLRLVTVHRNGAGLVVHVKGALETVLPLCSLIPEGSQARAITPADRTAAEQTQAALAERGLRVLAMAHREVAALPADAAPDQQLTLDGLVGLEDPPRPEVPTAIARCHAAGIRVVMITGDHPVTALAIGREIGLYVEAPRVLTGHDVAQLTDVQLWAALEAPDVLFARMAPEQKLRVVQTLQRHGAVVAATGDGVNDAPALRAADIGIAMGDTGSDVAREASDMVLLDDNFASIVAAVEEGRAVYDNIRKFLTYILTSNVPEAVPYLAYALLGWPLALTVPQILAVDLGTDLVPALGLGTEPAEPDVMSRPPRAPTSRLITGALLVRAYLFLGVFEAAAAMTAFLIVRPRSGHVAATTACLAAIVVMQVANVLACRHRALAAGAWWQHLNPLLVAGIALELLLMVGIAYTGPGQAIFGTAPIDGLAWLVPVPFALALLVADRAVKRLGREVRQGSWRQWGTGRPEDAGTR